MSDGVDSVRRILEVAVEKGLDLISITDHDTIEGSLEAMEVVSEEHLPIIILPGVEISTSSGHMLAYGITKDVESDMSMHETCKVVKKLGGVCFLAHPFDFMRCGSIKVSDFKVVDGVEVYNAKSYFNFLARKFAKKYSKPGIGGSDAHSASSVGCVVNYLENSNNILESLFNAKYKGHKIPVKDRIRFLVSRLRVRLNQQP